MRTDLTLGSAGVRRIAPNARPSASTITSPAEKPGRAFGVARLTPALLYCPFANISANAGTVIASSWSFCCARFAAGRSVVRAR